MKTSRFTAMRLIGGTGCIVLLFLGGCQTAGVAVHPEQMAAAAAGMDNAIVFDTKGGPLDVVADDGRETLTLTDAVREAATTHPEIQAALARVRVALADADQVRLLPNPILTLVLRLPEGGGKPVIEAGLAADLLTLLQRPGRIDAADGRLRAASAAAVAEVLDVIAEVQDRYYAVQFSQASVPLLETRRDLLNRLRDLARSRLEGGEGSRLDVVTFDAQQVEIEAEISALLLELAEQRLTLTRLIGRPSADVKWRVSDWQAPSQKSVGEGPWIAAALEHRPEVLQRVWDLEALGVEVRLARFIPFQGSSVGVAAERDGGWSVGPALATPLPLFDWGQAKRDRVEAQRIEGRHLLTQAQRSVVEEVRRAAAVFNESVHELERVRTRLIPLQQQRRDLAEAAFRAGQTDVTTVVLAEQDLAAARARAVSLERKNATALVRLERAAGGRGVAERLVRTTPAATSPSIVPIASAAPATRPQAPATRPAGAGVVPATQPGAAARPRAAVMPAAVARPALPLTRPAVVVLPVATTRPAVAAPPAVAASPRDAATTRPVAVARTVR